MTLEELIEEKPLDKVLLCKKVCASLQSTDRKQRKNAYIDLQNFLSTETVEFSEQDLRNIFNETHVYTVHGLRDKTESVREQCIQYLHFLIIDKLPLNDFYLTYMFPVIVERIGTVELIEESEEVRLKLLTFLEAIILKYSKSDKLKPFLNDCITILSETVKDKYPAIKELSCQTIINLSKALPRDFHMQAENLVKPVLTCFSHQRFKVRVEAIKAIGEIIMHSSYKPLDECIGALADKLFDQIPIVRRMVARVGALWMLEYRDRYSFFHKIMPLLLTGLNDEVEETRNEAHELWEKVGLQYQKENESDLKEQLDFLTTLPKYYPTKYKRPNLGCRTLVQRNVGKIAKALATELTSWQEDIRFRCSQLLCSIALLAEDGLTMHLQELLPAMYSASRDDDVRVVLNISQASELIGLFVPYETWCKLVLPAIEDGPHYGHLLVLSGLINGAPQEYICGSVEEVAKLLSQDYICCSRKKKYQLELLKCVQTISSKYKPTESSMIGFYLFKILVVLLALKDSDNASKIDLYLFKDLSKTLQLTSSSELWRKYSCDLLFTLNNDPKAWTKVSDDCLIFLTVISECNEAFGENLEVIAEILVKALDEDADCEQKLKTLYVLAEVFEKKDVIFKRAVNLTEFLEKLITDVFVPSLIWHAGASSEAIRTMSSTCLKYALMPVAEVDLFASPETLRGICDKLMPLLLSLVEDASYRSRRLGMECLMLLKESASQKNIWTVEDMVKVYPEILKRLDDPTPIVRTCALEVLPKIFSNPPKQFLELHYRAHHELIVDTLFTHFDDDDPDVQNQVFEILKSMVPINRQEVEKKVERLKPLLRNQEGLEEMARYLQENIVL